jgi:hypothetical protein
MVPFVLLLTRVWNLTNRLSKSLSDFAGDTLWMESVDHVTKASQRDTNQCQALISVGERHWAWQFSSPTLRAFK